MFWLLTAAKRLRELGILGMNRRNAACILDHNPRGKFPLVDDKLRLDILCRKIGVATPEIYGVIRYHSMLRRLPELLGERCDFVVKPNQGSAGRGVLVLVGRKGEDFLRHNGGIGTGIDLDSGLTHHAVQRNRFIDLHPDTGLPVVGLRVPHWGEILEMSQRVAEAVGLGYVGVDIVVDAERGPLLLEANAR